MNKINWIVLLLLLVCTSTNAFRMFKHRTKSHSFLPLHMRSMRRTTRAPIGKTTQSQITTKGTPQYSDLINGPWSRIGKRSNEASLLLNLCDLMRANTEKLDRRTSVVFRLGCNQKSYVELNFPRFSDISLGENSNKHLTENYDLSNVEQIFKISKFKM